jgi:ribosome-associated heat shock protein Hsp15
MSGAEPSRESVRADKWLWAARIFKTRSLAAVACAGGRVEINQYTAKPARLVHPGDRIRVTLSDGKHTLVVLKLSDRRGPAAAARALYEDLTPPAPPRLRLAPPVYRASGAGRPTKRERRLLDRLRSC